MIIPSIDLMDGQTVQLIGGKERALDLGDPMPYLEEFRLVGETAVVDLDAALSKGSNEALVEKLVRAGPCRVGGGIRSVDAAVRWLDAGATKVVIGTAARPEVLSQLPRDRVCVALDALHGEVVVEGWTAGTGARIEERIAALQPFAAHFLVTFVETEGRLQGIDLARAGEIVRAADRAKVTIAGGVTTVADVRALDRLGADAQVGMALYAKRFSIVESLSALLDSDREDGLWPTVVCDERGQTLGLVWSNEESLRLALQERRGVYWSRKRGLWRKGASSGAIQELVSVRLDCDRDSLLFVVRQQGSGFCHLGQPSCFGGDSGLSALMRRIAQSDDQHSYTKRLLGDSVLLNSKLQEEARELTEAVDPTNVVHEAADVAYFMSVLLQKAGMSWVEVERELDRRSLRVTRRPGNAK
jgi:phosphoribosyl-ATP pyrophosphohydrolase/phosphoribosyl-AMP cyclohydrolase